MLRNDAFIVHTVIIVIKQEWTSTIKAWVGIKKSDCIVRSGDFYEVTAATKLEHLIFK